MSEQAALDKKAIRKEILALIIPIILESIFVYLAGIVSASLVGHLSGLAVATQGLANRITGLLNVVWGAVRIGSMVYYVNLIGEGKYGELKQGFKNICTVTLGIAIGFVLILFLFPSQILSFFTEDVELIASAKSYLHITLLALPLWVMTKMNSAMFNAMGDTKTPMYLQVLINVVNIALGYLLIFILKWDFYGAAIATAVSQIAGGGVGIVLLNRKEYFRQAGKTGWGISDKESIKETLLKSIPVGLEDGMWQIYAIIMTKFLLTYGTNAYAGFQLATAAEEITELPVIGFTVAATTLAGRAKSQKSGPLFREYFKQQLRMNGTISALCQTAEGCFCDAAAGAEDHAAAGADGERGVGGRGLQICKLDPQLPDHGGQLLGGEDGVDVRLPVPDEFLPLGLHLLCRTRHDGHVEGLQAAFLVGGLIVFL